MDALLKDFKRITKMNNLSYEDCLSLKQAGLEQKSDKFYCPKCKKETRYTYDFDVTCDCRDSLISKIVILDRKINDQIDEEITALEDSWIAIPSLAQLVEVIEGFEKELEFKYDSINKRWNLYVPEIYKYQRLVKAYDFTTALAHLYLELKGGK